MKFLNKKIITTIIACMTIVFVGAGMLMPAEVSAASSKPSQVKSLKVSSKGYNSLRISWKKVKGAKGYQVYRATSKNGRYKKVKTTKSTAYTNGKLTTGKRYYYKIRAYKGSRKGKFSSKRSGVPQLSQTTAKAAAKSSSAIQVTWNKISGAKGYQVYRATSKSGKYSRIKTTTARSYTNGSLSASKTYYYKVRSYRKVGKSTKYSSFSSVRSAKTKARVPAVKPSEPTAPTEPTNPVPVPDPKPVVEERTDCYLQYGSTKIWIGQDWSDSVNINLNNQCGQTGTVAHTVKRTNSGDGYGNVYIYEFDTIDYSDYLIVYVCNNKIIGWNTTADTMGSFEGTIIRSNTPASEYENLGTSSDGASGLYVDKRFTEKMSNDSVFSQGNVVLAGICDIEGTGSARRTSLVQEERFAEHIINALRVKHGLNPLSYNEALYDASGTYGTLAYAKTMVESKTMSHSAAALTAGPLKGTSTDDRADIIENHTNGKIYGIAENVAQGYGVAESLIKGWYTSPGHKAALLTTTKLQNYNPPTEMAVAGAESTDGLTYWAFQAAVTPK